ncbi:PTS transporter subunit EIIC [Lacticaseibacillus baoqingensis]|uniref:PTS transporter subunit EIIC n=1 Tax=Lacticaseibacillus baoqingensis TaxID=2486013 RepID=A0ABW4E6V1_9LACO|nr:PTS transporter subunit EIIC [Lacticaseibacillus baoqingensis]
MSKFCQRYYHSRFYHVVTATFAALMPLILIGTGAQALLLSIFSRDGFFAVIFDLAHWVPGFVQIHIGLGLIVTYTLGLSGLLAAVFAARAASADQPRWAALTSGVGWLILNTSPLTSFGPNLGLDGLLPGLIFGAGCGWLFAHLRKPQWLAPVLLVLAAALRVGITTLAKNGSTLVLTAWPAALTGATSHWSLHTGLVALINSGLGWLGLPTPIPALAPMMTSATATANLHAALANRAIPYPNTLGTLYRPFALFGGVGMTLALVIAILLVDRRPAKRRLAYFSLAPSLVNLNWPLLLGYSVVLEPVLLVPFFLAPLAATGIAWLALHWHLMAPAVYQVPATTPGPLLAWLATNGNWPALVVALLGLAVAVAIYLPFVKMLAGGGAHA